MDIWDWLKSLRRWWWMIVLFPILAGVIGWFTADEPMYESSWSVNVVFNEPTLANSPEYFDYIFLDDFDLLMKTGALGDVIYLRLPDEAQSALSREEFGTMVSSERWAHFVTITVSGDDPDMVRLVAETISAHSEEVANTYLVPPTYTHGSANVNLVDPITDPALNTEPRMRRVGAVVLGVGIASVAATGVAEWLRISYRAKYSAK